jgi:hypothetical protein
MASIAAQDGAIYGYKTRLNNCVVVDVIEMFVGPLSGVPATGCNFCTAVTACCSRLDQHARSSPVAIAATYAYLLLFDRCERLKVAPDLHTLLPAEVLCYNRTGSGCVSGSAPAQQQQQQQQVL